MTNRNLNLVRGGSEGSDSTAFTSTPPPGGGDGGWELGVERRLTTIESEIRHCATEASVERVRTEISKSANRTIMWVVGVLVGLAGAGVLLFVNVVLPLLEAATSSSGTPLT